MASTVSPSKALLPGLLLAVSLHAFHAMAVVTVIPQVAEDLDGRTLYGAFFSSYLLASLLGLVWAGTSIGRTGARRVLGVSLTVFGIGLLGSALAPSMPLLVGARGLEGFGGGGVSSVLYAIVNRSYGDDERPRVLAWMSGAWVLPGLLGPPVAGAVAELLGWRWVFLGVLPLVVAAAAMTLPAIPRIAGVPDGATEDASEGSALVQAGVMALGVGAVLFGLSRPPGVVEALVAGVGAVVLLAAARRILPAGTLTARVGLPAAIATKFLINFSFFGAEAFLPLALRELRDFSLTGAGLVLTGAALSWTTGAFVHSRLAARVAPGLLAGWGGAAVLLGIGGIVLLVASDAPDALAFAAWALAGFGIGVAYNTATTEAMSQTDAGHEGRTSTALGMADSLGFALAAGLGGAILAAGGRAGLPTGHSIGWICVTMALAGAVLFWTATRLRPERPLTRPQTA
ncbi:MAG: MFS transporter [Myxococcota bacterium]|nr:MFS transporter [Myxococcota bacterium]